jgi:hypothetical protein
VPAAIAKPAPIRAQLTILANAGLKETLIMNTFLTIRMTIYTQNISPDQK